MRFPIALAVYAAALCAAAAQGAKYPREIEALFEAARKSCREDMAGATDATTVTFKPAAIRKLDLSGDGRDDYIVDYGQAACDDNGAFFCGSGGCNLTILVARPNGSFVTVFDDQVLNYRLSAGPGARTITINPHHSDCAGRRDVCVKRARITGKPLALKEVKR